MNKKIPSLFLALAAATAWGGPEIGKSGPFPRELNIAVDINAPGAIRAEVAISTPSLKEVQRYELQVSDGALVGGVYLPPGKDNFVSITTFDAHGEKLYAGEGNVAIGESFTPQLDIRLEGRETKDPLTAKFGTYRLGLGLAAGPGEGGLIVEATLFDALGNHLPFKPDDIQWGGLPEKFELLPYSCFRESLCIELPDPRVHEDLIACMRDVVCSHKKPKDTRGPYWYVVTGRNHTCALTTANEIRCWGDNRYGQLRSAPSACPSGVAFWPSDCSTVPLPIQCGPGEVCKFVSLAAGGERTCAVDTAGKLWCWGADPDVYDGIATFEYANRFNGEIEATTANENPVTFIAVDTDLRTTCAISSTRALYCWDFHTSQLTDFAVKNPGTLYASVSVGKKHVCATQVSGKFECWGDNFDGQLNGTHTGSSGVLHPGLQEILTRGGHRPAAGATSSCAQDPDDNTICWGSPSHWVGSTTATRGWMALRHSYATSLASNTDSCAVGGGGSFECTRICATGLGGDLFCGNWKSWAPPTQLPMVPPPASDHYVSWNQMDVGPNHVCAVNTQQDIWCFGTNAFGQFGIGTISTTRTDMPVTPVNR